MQKHHLSRSKLDFSTNFGKNLPTQLFSRLVVFIVWLHFTHKTPSEFLHKIRDDADQH